MDKFIDYLYHLADEWYVTLLWLMMGTLLTIVAVITFSQALVLFIEMVR